MTHTEALRNNNAGLPPTDCPGELLLLLTGKDADAAVRVYGCDRCGRRVVLEAVGGPYDGLRLVNDYDADPGKFVRELAASWKMPENPLPGKDRP